MEQPRTEEITLYAPGSIPGIPGEHPAGIITVDWSTRQVVLVRPLPALAGPEAELENAAPASPVQATPQSTVSQPSALVLARPSNGSNGG